MKREGYQHGRVRSCKISPSPLNPRPASRRCINKLDSPTTAGPFTKVQTKPTNHSKFTGKCGKPRCTDCHLHPCCKSKDKTKGERKLKSCDVVANHRLMTWRVVDGLNCNRFDNVQGLSATRMLVHLGRENDESEDFYLDGDDEEEEEELDVGVQEFVDDYDNLSVCDAGFVLDQVEGEEDEGWCLVAQL